MAFFATSKGTNTSAFLHWFPSVRDQGILSWGCTSLAYIVTHNGHDCGFHFGNQWM